MTGFSHSDPEFTRKILDISPIGICVLDADGRFTFANTRGQEILALRLDEMTRRYYHSPEWEVTDLEGNPIRHGDFLFERIRISGEPLSGVRMIVRRDDGDRVVISANALPLRDDNGDFDGMIASFEDVTYRIELEELSDNAKRLEKILWQVPVGIQIVDEEGRNVYANRRAQEILGLSFDEITRRYYHSTEWHVTDMEGNLLGPRERIFSRVKESLQPLNDQKMLVQRPDDHWIAISVNAQPLFDELGRFSGLTSAIKDITDMVLLERELVHHRAQLEETVRQRTLNLEQLNLQLRQEAELRGEREVELESANRRLQALSLFLQSTREKESSRSALRIHNDIGQNLTVLQMALKNLEKEHLRGDGGREAMRSVYVITEQLADLVKTISAELRPPILDDAGLSAALEWQCSDFQENTGIACTVVQGVGDASLDLDKTTAVFRIFQEIMRNLALLPGIEGVDVETRLDGDVLVVTVGVEGSNVDEADLRRVDPISLDFMREYIRKFGGEVGIIASREGRKAVVVRVPA